MVLDGAGLVEAGLTTSPSPGAPSRWSGWITIDWALALAAGSSCAHCKDTAFGGLVGLEPFVQAFVSHFEGPGQGVEQRGISFLVPGRAQGLYKLVERCEARLVARAGAIHESCNFAGQSFRSRQPRGSGFIRAHRCRCQLQEGIG